MPRGGQVGRWLTILDELQALRVGVPAEILGFDGILRIVDPGAFPAAVVGGVGPPRRMASDR